MLHCCSRRAAFAQHTCRRRATRAGLARFNSLMEMVFGLSPANDIMHITNPIVKNGLNYWPVGADWIAYPGRLVSLFDMLQVFAQEYIALGQKIESMKMLLFMASQSDKDEDKELQEDEKQDLIDKLTDLSNTCSELGLVVSDNLIRSALIDLPRTMREMSPILRAVSSELKTRLFFYIPQERARYYESNIVLDKGMVAAFPLASVEILSAGNCYAVGEYTASVFHSMRAAEIGLRAVANNRGVTFSRPLDQAEWQTLIEQIEEKLKTIRQQPRSQTRDEELKFFSDANSHFSSLKDAFRNHVAHARDVYGEVQSLSILRRVTEFLETLSTKVSE